MVALYRSHLLYAIQVTLWGCSVLVSVSREGSWDPGLRECGRKRCGDLEAGAPRFALTPGPDGRRRAEDPEPDPANAKASGSGSLRATRPAHQLGGTAHFPQTRPPGALHIT